MRRKPLAAECEGKHAVTECLLLFNMGNELGCCDFWGIFPNAQEFRSTGQSIQA